MELPKLIKSLEIESVLIVTDEGITSIGLMDNFLQALHEESVNFFIYDKTVPNPAAAMQNACIIQMGD